MNGKLRDSVRRGKRIRRLREQTGRTQAAIAEELGVSPRVYQRWEAGSTKPSEPSLAALAGRFNTTVEFVLHGDPADAKPAVDAISRRETSAINAIRSHDAATRVAIRDLALSLDEVRQAVAALQGVLGDLAAEMNELRIEVAEPRMRRRDDAPGENRDAN